MKILIVGGTGTIGAAVTSELKKRHEVISAGFSDGEFQIDISNNHSIESLYKKIGKLDAVIATTGKVHFGEFIKMTEEEYFIGLKSKLMGQVNLVRMGLDYLNDGGSFTLTSGLLSDDPIRYGVSAAMVNGAINSFVLASAIEMPRGIRINVVSPTVVAEAMPHYENYFRGFKPVAASEVALAYSKSVEGLQTGKVYAVGW